MSEVVKVATTQSYEFWLLITGHGEGCDYAIDCNKIWKKIDGCTSMEDAHIMVETMFETGNLLFEGERGVKSISILQVKDAAIFNVQQAKTKIERQANVEEKQKEEAEDLAKMAELKMKYPEKFKEMAQ